jgi:hypothetical protein
LTLKRKLLLRRKKMMKKQTKTKSNLARRGADLHMGARSAGKSFNVGWLSSRRFL